MKKKVIVAVSIVLVVAIAVGIWLAVRTRSLEDFYCGSGSEVTKISITNGNNGEVATITDADKCKEVAEYLADVKVSRDWFAKEKSGWTYRVTLYFGGESLDIVSSPLSIDGDEYQYKDETKNADEINAYLAELMK